MFIMSNLELLSFIVTAICLVSFSIVFTYLFRNYFLNSIKNISDGREDIEIIDTFLDETKKNKSKKNKVFKVIGKVISYSLLGFVFVFFCFSLTSRILNNNMLVGDSGFVVIASGSMEERNKDNTYLDEFNLSNQISTYDIIGLKRYNSASDVKLYDVIAFKDKEGRTIVHRIVSLEESEGELVINTRGDSNSVSDANQLYNGYLSYNDIIGKYTDFRIPLLGSFIVFIQSNSGIVTIVAVFYCFLMFDFYRSKLDKTITERTNLLVELIDYDIDTPNVNNYFKQELIYKGYKYIFEKGEFKFKEVISDDLIKEDSDNKMYSQIVIDENDPSKNAISVKDIKEDTITKINCEKESPSFTNTIKSLFSKKRSDDNA